MDIKKQNMVNSIFDTFSSVYFFTLTAEELSITTTKINRHGLLQFVLIWYFLSLWSNTLTYLLILIQSYIEILGVICCLAKCSKG